MTTVTPAQFCAHHNACLDGAEFAAKYKTMAGVWDACPRADWLLWILEKLEVRDDKKLRLFAVWCVRNTKRVARGEATQKELAAARAAARASIWAAEQTAWDVAGDAEQAAWDVAWCAAQQQQADHLRTVFSNPFKEGESK